MGQTVNLLAYAFGGSNPSLPTCKKECRLELQNPEATVGKRPEREQAAVGRFAKRIGGGKGSGRGSSRLRNAAPAGGSVREFFRRGKGFASSDGESVL